MTITTLMLFIALVCAKPICTDVTIAYCTLNVTWQIVVLIIIVVFLVVLGGCGCMCAVDDN